MKKLLTLLAVFTAFSFKDTKSAGRSESKEEARQTKENSSNVVYLYEIPSNPLTLEEQRKNVISYIWLNNYKYKNKQGKWVVFNGPIPR